MFDNLQDKGIKTGFIQILGQHTLEIYIMQRVVLERYVAGLYQTAVAYIGKNMIAENRLIYDLFFTLFSAVLLGTLLLKISNAVSKYPRINRILFGKSSKVKMNMNAS